MPFHFIELASVLVFFIGFYGIITSKNILKSIISIGIMEMAAVVFILSIGFSEGMNPPVGLPIHNAADPLPQAMVITAIIIGLTVTAVNLTMLLSLFRQHQTADWDKAKQLNSE